MIRRRELSPEEHLAAHGTRADHRVRVWRRTYGPGARPNGSRFRDEVAVCTRCRAVTVSRLLGPGLCIGTTGRRVRRMDAMSPGALRELIDRGGRWVTDEKLRALVPEPCPGRRMSPTAEVGHRWLEGETIEGPEVREALVVSALEFAAGTRQVYRHEYPEEE